MLIYEVRQGKLMTREHLLHGNILRPTFLIDSEYEYIDTYSSLGDISCHTLG